MDEGFEAMYQSGTPPWDIGRPQPAFVRLEETGAIRGRVLDAGCGTGELVLYLASRGHDAWGFDGSETARSTAKAKATQRGLKANFVQADALQLKRLGERFDTITDCGLFHVFSDDERPKYVAALAATVRPGGNYFMLCFSEREPDGWGPRRVTQAEIRQAFQDGWEIRSIIASRFATNVSDDGAHAWLASIRRVPSNATR